VTWLLDTNVVSELRRPRPEKRVIAFFAATPLAELYLSTVTLAEIQFGIDTLPIQSASLSSRAGWKARFDRCFRTGSMRCLGMYCCVGDTSYIKVASQGRLTLNPISFLPPKHLNMA
jgi:hypothetical protein